MPPAVRATGHLDRRRRNGPALAHAQRGYAESPMDSRETLLGLTSKVAGHEINTQKSTAFLYTSNKRAEITHLKVPFTSRNSCVMM